MHVLCVQAMMSGDEVAIASAEACLAAARGSLAKEMAEAEHAAQLAAVQEESSKQRLDELEKEEKEAEVDATALQEEQSEFQRMMAEKMLAL